MKKITFLLFAIVLSSTLSAQTITTGDVTLTTDYTANLEVSPTLVTLTLFGPNDRWFGLGFRDNDYTAGSGMDAGGDVFIYTNAANGGFTDRTFVGISILPTADAINDWTLVSDDDDTPSAGSRTVVVTRTLSTGEANDFVFSNTATTIDLVFARTNNTSDPFLLGYHGPSPNRGAVTGVTFTTLSTPDFNTLDFSISPNPANARFNITLPNSIQSAKVQVIDILGKTILQRDISDVNASINVSNWNSGIYIVRVSSGDASQSKRFVKQ